MTLEELIAALEKKGAAPSPIGCVGVLLHNWNAVKNCDPEVPAPKIGDRYAYWPEYEWLA